MIYHFLQKRDEDGRIAKKSGLKIVWKMCPLQSKINKFFL